MNKNWLPQNKNTLAIAIIAIAVVIVFLIFQYSSTNKNTKKIEIAKNSAVKSAKDTDGDGLKDWEENLWGTNINKVDTDGDGVNDFDFVQKQKKLPSYTTTKKPDININYNNLTETDKLSRSAFSTYLQLKQTNNLNKENVGVVFDKLVKNELKNNNYTNKYTTKDIILEGNTQENIESYKSTLLEKITPIYKIKENEIYLIVDILNGVEDKSRKKDVFKYADVYKTVSKDIMTMKVPKGIAQDHKNLANSYYLIYKSLYNMMNMEKDPVAGMKSIDDIQVAQENLNSSVEKINTFLKINGII